jgi:hypothetical protein
MGERAAAMPDAPASAVALEEYCLHCPITLK